MPLVYTLHTKSGKTITVQRTVEGERQRTAALKGRRFSDAATKHLSEIRKGKCVGSANHFYGKHHSSDTLARLSAKLRTMGLVPNNKGTHLSIDARKRLSEAQRGIPHLKARKSGNSVIWIGGERFFNSQYFRTYRKQHTDAVRHWKRQRLFRERGAIGSYTLEQWFDMKRRYNFTCPSCHIAEPAIKLTADHIVPLSLQGPNTIDNIQPLCSSCNSRKHTKVIQFALAI